MFKTKNRIFLGIISGITSAFVGGSLNALEYRLGLIDVTYNQISTSLFIPKSKIQTSQGIFIGSIIRYIIVGFVSTSIYYILSFSGPKNATLKSIGLTITTWLLAVELIPKFVLNIRIHKPLYHYLTFLDHILSALIISKLILKFGDKSIFTAKHEFCKEYKIGKDGL